MLFERWKENEKGEKGKFFWVGKIRRRERRERGRMVDNRKKEGSVREYLLDAGVHFDVGAHWFFGLDGLWLLWLFSLFGGFGGARDSRLDFGGARDRRFDSGGVRFSFFCRSGVRPFFSGEAVEFVLSRYRGFHIVGWGGRGLVYFCLGHG